MIERDRGKDARARIANLVNSETKAWDTQDVELLLSILHPDMVWPWNVPVLAISLRDSNE
jgi:hypothetical protein